MTEHIWTYTHDESNQEVHLYNSNSNEINKSPVDVSGGDANLEIPGDIIGNVALELQKEVNDNQQAGNEIIITDYAMECIQVLAAPERFIEKQ